MKRWKMVTAVVLLAAAGISIYFGWGKYRDNRRRAELRDLAAMSGSGPLRELSGGDSITTEVNAKAPGFAGMTFDGEEVRSIDFIGEKVVLLEFWSVFCTSCIQEMPRLAELHEKYGGEGLEVIGVNTDFFPPERVRKFLDRLEPPPPYRIVSDQDQKISKAFNVEALPVTVLIDSTGWIRMYHLGYKPGDEKVIEKSARKWLGRVRGEIETVGHVDGRTAVAVEGRGTVAAGSPLPGFSAPDMGGQVVSSADLLEGRAGVIFFWSLFCQPCRLEMPYLAKMSGDYGSEGPVFLSVNLDSPRLADSVGKFLEKEPLPFTTLMDSLAEPSGAVSRTLGIAYTPTLITVDEGGMVRKVIVGGFTPEEMEASVAEVAGPG
jgi:thiol-disulfide isomerase/thioredoxin